MYLGSLFRRCLVSFAVFSRRVRIMTAVSPNRSHVNLFANTSCGNGDYKSFSQPKINLRVVQDILGEVVIETTAEEIRARVTG